MRKIVASALIALLVAAPGAAFAASSTSTPAKPATAAAAATPQTIASTVKAFDLKAHTLTLANGVSYVLPATFKDPGLKVGEKVHVKYQMNGKTYNAIGVTIG